MNDIRRLTPDDLNTFKTIRLSALQTEPDAFASSFEDAVNYTDDDWRTRMRGLLACAFDADGDPIGLMGVARNTLRQSGHRGTLIMVYVDPVHRRSGIAARLLAFVEAEAQSEGINQLELVVRADNLAARGFYASAGYTYVGRLPNALQTPRGEIAEFLMARRLCA